MVRLCRNLYLKSYADGKLAETKGSQGAGEAKSVIRAGIVVEGVTKASMPPFCGRMFPVE